MKNIILIILVIAIMPITAFSAGVTILTHGFSRTNGPIPLWLSNMRASIRDRWILPYSQDQFTEYGEIEISQTILPPFNLVATIESWPNDINSERSEFLIILNWVNE